MTLHIGFLIFPDLQQLDLTGPHDVFASLPGTEIHLVGATLDPVRSTAGLVFTPTTTLQTCPDLDVVCVPGGVGVNPLMLDAAVLDFLRRQAKTCRFVSSVCTGSLVLGAAGLLQGRRATSHWLARDLLRHFGAIPTEGRMVRDGHLVTAGGVTAGIDFGLTMVAELVDRAAAETIQLSLEYAPAPPFDAGTPETAPPALVDAVRARAAANRSRREAIVAEAAARLQRSSAPFTR